MSDLSTLPIFNSMIVGWWNEEYDIAEFEDMAESFGCNAGYSQPEKDRWADRIKEAQAANNRGAAEYAVMWWRICCKY